MHVDLVALMEQGAQWDQIPGYIGAAFVIASFLSKTMIPLRALSMASNLCFIGYSMLHLQYPTLVMHCVLLPLNAVRLQQMIKLVKRVRTAASGDNTMNWLKPYMRRRHCRAGQVLFRAGDVADRTYYIVSGQFRVTEIGVTLQPGGLVGELGLLSPGGRRGQSLECIEDGDLLSIGYDQVQELYFQNPDFGFYFLRLATGRLFQNLETLQKQLAEARAALAQRDATAIVQPGP
jgi:CRP/FNR family transcriptional regulator, cyclic AMP receptor protein